MDLSLINKVYFIGIGGIGMSALARYFHKKGIAVSGYDKTRTPLTQKLINEGIKIVFDDDALLADLSVDLVVYTPAIPSTNNIRKAFEDAGKTLYKRSDILEWITKDKLTLAVAGTHGKTTISTMLAYILKESGLGCTAFLGGISANYQTNFWSTNEDIMVVEADEYDRSFLKLSPDIATISAMDADHLDIYGTVQAMEDAFIDFSKRLKGESILFYKHGLPRGKELDAKQKMTYSLQNSAANIHAKNIRLNKGGYIFDIVSNEYTISDVQLELGGMHNVENSIAAIAMAKQLDIEDYKIKKALASFKGVKRRFEYVIKNNEVVFIDDYAHHPEELSALIKSAKTLFPKRRCVVAFQPHLYSRTKDLAQGFAHSLDLADEVIILDIYPARELPIEGVTSEIIAQKMGNPNHTIMTREGLIEYVKSAPIELLITAGAGDIDQVVEPIAEILAQKTKA